jgi:hypothetical protein
MIEVTADAVRVAIAADRSEATKLPGNKMDFSQPIERPFCATCSTQETLMS